MSNHDSIRARYDNQGEFSDFHRRSIERMRSTRSYFTFCHAFLDLGLDIEQAAVLQDMINVASFNRASAGDGWFTYTSKLLEKRLKLKRDAQQRLINNLIKLNFIKKRYAGLPAKRQLWIDLIKIENELAIIDSQKMKKRSNLFKLNKRRQVNRNEVFKVNKPSPTELVNESTICYGESRKLVNEESRKLYKRTNSSLRSEKEPMSPRPATTRRFAASSSPVKDDRESTEGQFYTEPTKSSPLHQEFARRLRQVVITVHKYMGAWSEKKWADQFRLLEKDCGGDTARVNKVLEWYEKNADSIKYPVVSAEKFRKRFFTELEVRCKEQTPTVTEFSSTVVNITSLVTSNHNWPVKAQRQMPAVVHKTLEAWEEFYAKVREFRGEVIRKNGRIKYEGDDERQDDLFRFIDHMAASGWLMKDSSAFAFKWFDYIYSKYGNWKQWSGDITKMAFNLENELTTEFGQTRAKEYASPKYWSRLLVAIGE